MSQAQVIILKHCIFVQIKLVINPFPFCFQFNDYEFPSLSGGRIVRIATHPDYQGVSTREQNHL